MITELYLLLLLVNAGLAIYNPRLLRQIFAAQIRMIFSADRGMPAVLSQVYLGESADAPNIAIIAGLSAICFLVLFCVLCYMLLLLLFKIKK